MARFATLNQQAVPKGLLNKNQILGLVLAAVAGAVLALAPHAHASFLPLPDTSNLDVPTPEGDTAFTKLENLLGPLGRNLRIIVGAIAVVLIVVSGFSMVISGDNEETEKNQKKSITYGIIGLLMISIAGPIAEVFDYREGDILTDPSKLVERVGMFSDATRLVITFLKYMLGGLATLMFIRAGAIMIALGDSEEKMTREKKNLALGAGGLVMVMLSEIVVKKVFYVASFNESTGETQVSINQNEFLTQIVAITNILVSFVGPIMMLGIVAGGVLYVTAAGDEERTGLAKKILLNSVIGVVIIYGAFALVSTIIAGQF